MQNVKKKQERNCIAFVVIRRLGNPDHSILIDICCVGSEIKRPMFLIFELINEPLTCSLPVTTGCSLPGGEKRKILCNQCR